MGKPTIKRSSLGIRNITKPATLQETETTKELVTTELLFDYSVLENFSQDDVRELINIEKKIITNKKEVGKLAIETGRMLDEARGLFDRYSENPQSYMEWYQALGFNKDQVSLLRGRYKLSLEYPESKIIQTLSDAEIKQITNKKAPSDVIARVVNGEIRTAQGIKKAISRALEIEDAEIVEESEKDKLVSRLSEVEAKIRKLEEELKELKTVKAELKEKIKGCLLYTSPSPRDA